MRRAVAVIAALFLVPLLGLQVAAWLLADGPNYSLVAPGLYLGGHVPSSPPGVGFVLNLCETEDPYTAPFHAWEPIRDAEPAPSLAWLDAQVERIAGHRRAGRGVFVHCRNGVSRSGIVVVAYLMREHGWGLEEAMAFVRRSRPGLRPNPAFLARLREWEERERPAPDGGAGR